MNVFVSSETLAPVLFYNMASNTLPVVQVLGGCDSTPDSDLLLVGNTTDQRKFSVRCDGSTHADNAYSSGGGDIAEYFQSSTSTIPSPLTPGLVVSLNHGLAQVSTSSSRANTLGVIPTKPGFIGNSPELENPHLLNGNPISIQTSSSSYLLVGLLGQVPVQANATTDTIDAGDFLMAGENGLAIKAKGPGMVLGRAMESLSTTTGTITLSLDPHWWAGDLFQPNPMGTGSMLLADLLFTENSTSSIQSPSLTFQTSSSTFQLNTEDTSPTSSLFVIKNTSSTLLTLNQEGDLTLFSNLFFSKDTTTRSLTLNPTLDLLETNAKGITTQGTGFAEEYPSTQTLEEGDVVTLDPDHPGNIIRATAGTTQPVLGVVAVSPGFVGGHGIGEGRYMVVLMGTVNIKVQGSINHNETLIISTNQDGALVQGTDRIIATSLEDNFTTETKLVKANIQSNKIGRAHV